MDASSSAQVNPKVVLSAIDADVVKSYVEFGLGIAVHLSVAYERNAIADCAFLTPLICSRDDSSNRAVSREGSMCSATCTTGWRHNGTPMRSKVVMRG